MVGEVAQLLLAAAARVDVLHLRDPVQRLAVLAAHDRGGEVDPAHLPGEPAQAELDPQHRHLAAPQPLQPLAHEADVVEVHQLLERVVSDELLRATGP